ncbi:MAG: RES family NAD+ phosphorylase [Aquisalinus sp.]|nr:RES family NAD+ phosphorylase [Aquisalinus sp.]
MRRTLRDIELIDQVEALPIETYSGNVFRLVRDGRDPIACWHPEGRWDDGTFDVLYTATTEQGAIAEVRYHLSQQQPFAPDYLDYRMFRIPVQDVEVINLLASDRLTKLGVDLKVWGKSDYVSRGVEYLRTQEIAAVATFHEREGLLVPSARSSDANLVILRQATVDMRCGEPEDMGLADIQL